MPAAYDSYDYPSYWKGRDYEHKSEVIAIKALLEKVPKVKKALEIGGGFGRLISAYSYRAKKIIFTDPSARLLSIAARKHKKLKKIEFTQSKVENLTDKIKSRDFDLILMVRVLHHIDDVDKAFETISKLLNTGGYLIMEYPNKIHAKAIFKRFLKGDTTFPLELESIDLRSKRSVSRNVLPFTNFHPDLIALKLANAGFEIIEERSVSNIRSTLLKRLFPLKFLIEVESLLQALFKSIKVGPSVFVLARKRGI